jgi:hypothetical protein
VKLQPNSAVIVDYELSTWIYVENIINGESLLYNLAIKTSNDGGLSTQYSEIPKFLTHKWLIKYLTFKFYKSTFLKNVHY